MDRQLSRKLIQYYRTPLWKELSKAVKRRDGYRCRACGRKGQYPSWWQLGQRRIPLMAHHLRYTEWRRQPGSEPLDALITLCIDHHNEAHGRFDSGKYRTLRLATEDVVNREQRKLARQREKRAQRPAYS